MKEARILIVPIDSILHHFAGNAVRQSPYTCPDNLREAIEALKSKLLDSLKWQQFTNNFVYLEATKEELSELLYQKLKYIFLTTPEIRQWNEPNNGNQTPLQFVSRYDTKLDPDNDFIDLDALAGNVVECVLTEAKDI